MTPNLIDQLKAARAVSVPLIAINTPDPEATIKAVCEALNGKDKGPRVEWDCVRGFKGRNEAGTDWVAGVDPQPPYLMMDLITATKLTTGSVLFIHQADKFIGEREVTQAVWNLRDPFKSDKRTLILLSKSLPVPAALSDDLLVLDEELPDQEQLAGIVGSLHKAAELTLADETSERAVEALRGLSAFAAEQVTAMSLRKSGLNVDALWDRKRKTIEQTPGLKVFRGGETFKDVGGLAQVKDYMTSLLNGRSRPNAITWLDELDKAMPGQSHDTSGVSQDQLGTILSYMEDNGVLGVLFVGPPGSGKSAIAKAAGNSVGVPTVRFDLGACKGSLVGQSEQQIRNALRVISAISNERAMFIATANSIAGMDSALKRRFPFVFYFDLPSREEKDVIWSLWLKRYELTGDRPNDEGWSGANIQKCCECAWRLNLSPIQGSRFIVPCGKVSRLEIEKLRQQADGVFLSASDEGVYQMNKPATAAPSSGRVMNLE